MIPPEMTDWLLQQIDEDLMWAQEASRRGGTLPPNTVQLPVVTGVHWQWETSDDKVVTPDPALAEFVGEEEGSQVDLRSREKWPAHWSGGTLPQFAIHQAVEVPSAVGGHIIRHDPARVIADLTARRRTVRRCLERAGHGSPALAVFAEEILRDMTKGYKERPGYDPGWRPHDN